MMTTKKSSARQSIAPLDCPDPIQFLLDLGASPAQLAAAWGFRHTDAVYRLKRYEYAPKVKTAALMAKSLGWTLGDVLNHWWDKSTAQKEAVAR